MGLPGSGGAPQREVIPARKAQKKKEESQITPTPKGMGTPRSGGEREAQGHPEQSSSTRSTSATPL